MNIEKLLMYGITQFEYLTCSELVQIIDEVDRHFFEKAPARKGNNVLQEYFYTTLDIKRAPFTARKIVQLKQLLQEKLSSYFPIPLKFTQRRIHRYTETTLPTSLGMHRDGTNLLNIVVVLVLKNGGEFYFEHPEVPHTKMLVSTPQGSCIIMAGGKFNNIDIRPRHCVENVTQERLTLILGQEIAAQS